MMQAGKGENAGAEDGRIPARSTILLLGGIAALGSLATQLLVPALPSISGDLNITVAATQLILSVFLIGLGGGQLLVGPLADRMQRRNLLLLGLAVYALGSLIGSLTSSFEMLLLARLLQAIGSAAGLVTARVLVGSMVAPERAASAQASLMAVVLVSPALAPVIGGVLAEVFGWRWIMALLGAAAVAAALMVARRVPLLRAADNNVGRTKLLPIYRRVVRNPRFVVATAALACGSAALYVFVGALPFLAENTYHLSPWQTGLCLLLVASASIVGTRLVGRLERTGDPLLLASVLSLLAACALAAACVAGTPALPLLLAPLALVGLSAGVIGPTAISHVLASEPGAEGTATSLAGAAQMFVSALSAGLIGPIAAESVPNLAWSLVPLTGGTLLAALVLRR